MTQNFGVSVIHRGSGPRIDIGDTVKAKQDPGWILSRLYEAHAAKEAAWIEHLAKLGPDSEKRHSLVLLMNICFSMGREYERALQHARHKSDGQTRKARIDSRQKRLS